MNSSRGKPEKQELVRKIVESLSFELASIERSARAAHEAATHEESRAEDEHDTRGIEAGYLAGAQSLRAADIKRLLIVYREMPLREFDPGEVVSIGALVRAELDGKQGWYFLVGAGAAGLSVDQSGVKVQIVTGRSPLGEALMGRKAGESSELETPKGVVEIEILEVD